MHIAKCETDMTLEGLQFLVHIFVWSTETNVNGPTYERNGAVFIRPGM
jgi:hypothetical protein